VVVSIVHQSTFIVVDFVINVIVDAINVLMIILNVHHVMMDFFYR